MKPVSTHGLGRRFGDEDAVVDLTFEVEAGEIFGIVGPDGAGKTTTLRMLAGVLPPTSGRAHVLGIDVAEDPEAVKSRAAYMAQRFGLYEDLTVAENIAFYADLYRVPAKERPARLERLYEFSGLGPFRDRLVGNLSGGMKQKASLSAALIHHPEVLLLDEPTFGVDPISRRDLWVILHEMAGDGMTIVLTTSYLDEAERCDRVAVLDHGRLLAYGTPASLQAEYGTPIVAAPMGRDRALPARLAGLPGVSRVVAFGDEVHVSTTGDIEDVRRVVAAAGLDAARVHVIEPSLEDVFLAKVGDV